jgi:hypothetical protein
MASAHGDVEAIVVTGLRRRDAMVAPEKGSLARSVGEIGLVGSVGGVSGGVGGRRSFAASQSSSTNYNARLERENKWIIGGPYLAQIASYAVW